MNNERKLFSYERLLETMKKYKDCPPKKLLTSIKQELDIFSNGSVQADDITMLALEIVHYSTAESAIEELIEIVDIK